MRHCCNERAGRESTSSKSHPERRARWRMICGEAGSFAVWVAAGAGLVGRTVSNWPSMSASTDTPLSCWSPRGRGTACRSARCRARKDVDFDSSIAWRGKSDEVCYLGDVHATIKVCSVRGLNTDSPTAHILTPDNTVIHSFSFDDSGLDLVLNQTGTTYARDLFLSSPRQLRQAHAVDQCQSAGRYLEAAAAVTSLVEGGSRRRGRGAVGAAAGLQAGNEAADGGPAARGADRVRFVRVQMFDLRGTRCWLRRGMRSSVRTTAARRGMARSSWST